MENNTAFVATLQNIRSIEGADKIKLADVTLKGVPITQVIVGNTTVDGTKVVYFDANMALEDGFVEYIDKQSPDYGKDDFNSIGKYLAKGNRVRVIKLRGVISNGLIIEVGKFPVKDMPEGYGFVALGDFKVCHKWIPVVKHERIHNKEHKRGKKISRLVPDQFRFYVDTEQLLRNVEKISPNDVGSISRKIHGTSAIVSNVLVNKKLPIIDKIAKMLGATVVDKIYDYLYASRTVIKNDATSTGFYKTDVWTDVGKKYFFGKLHPGETVYYEIVGYLPGSQSMIQKGYDYGNRPGDCSIAVYRITSTSVDGQVTNLDWASMKERCKEMEAPMVEEFFYGRFKDKYPEIPVDENWHKKFAEALKKEYLEKDVPNNLCKKVPDEGVVLRVEGMGIRVYKLKSERFFLQESVAREEEVVDIEAEESNGTEA